MISSKTLRNGLWIVLVPLSLVWAAVTWLRRRTSQPKYRSPLFVVSVGNLHSGGSGKTPLVRELLTHFGERAAVLSRGYRGKLTDEGGKVSLADSGGPAKYGDEPWMLAVTGKSDVYVDKDRVRAIRRIETEKKHSVVILDDGFQHYRLGRDVDLVLINGARELSDAFCLPYGELREPLSSLKKADAVLLLESNDEPTGSWRTFLGQAHPELPLFRAERISAGLWEDDVLAKLDEGTRLGGFCGLAWPDGFASDLQRKLGAGLLRSFPDHHAYDSRDIDELLAKKRRLGLDFLVTTEKDFHKAYPLFKARGERLFSYRIRYELDEKFWYFLDQRLERK